LRRSFTFIAALLTASCGQPELSVPSSDDLQALHDRLVIIDSHMDIRADFATETLDPGGLTDTQFDLPQMRAGGVDGGFFVVYVPQGPLTQDGYAEAHSAAEAKYEAIARMARAYPDQIALAVNADDVAAILDSDRLVALMGMENAYALGPDIGALATWRDRGLSYVSLTHFGHNQFGGSSDPVASFGDTEIDRGLTDLGRELIAALNDFGIIVDVSHAGRTTMMETVALSRAPVIASHSGAFGVNEHPRNLDDEQLRAIRDNGGVVQIMAFRSYLRTPSPEQAAERTELRERFGVHTSRDFGNLTEEDRTEYLRESYAIRDRYPDVTVSDLVDHIDHAVAVAGIDHVGISSDFGGGGGVLGWDDASEAISVTRELHARGYNEEDMAKLWGGNLLRVMRTVEAAAIR